MTSNWLSVCETGECLEIQIQGDTVVLRETSTPDVEVVTPLASWQAWQDKARAPLLAEVERLKANQTPDGGEWTVYAVVFSNYEPPEVDSLWRTHEKAQSRADQRNDGAVMDFFRVVAWKVDGCELGVTE